MIESRYHIRKYYGLFFLAFFECCFICFLMIFKNNLYIAINDNLDSNIALFKMFHDYSMWRDRTIPIPMLGGLDRTILNCGYSLSHILYYIFSTETAYWMHYVIASVLSGVGFYLLGNSLKNTFEIFIDANLMCVLGCIYSFIGIWPHALIAFSLIPWWAFLVLEVYRTGNIWLGLLFLPIEYNISGPLIGIFMVFYTFIFCVLMFFLNREKQRNAIYCFGTVIFCFIALNRSLILKGSKGTIKSLASNSGLYSDTIKACTEKLFNLFFLLKDVNYHSGAWALRYVALPLVIVFFIMFNVFISKLRIAKSFLVAYDFCFGAIFVNACFAAFDRCYGFRNLLPYLSGFSFFRFMWLSPFFVFLAISLIVSYLKAGKFKYFIPMVIIAIPFSIMIDFDSTSSSSIYNTLHINYVVNILKETIEQQARWKDFYATDLFDQIKTEIDYDDEWGVAYGMEPSVLQYNGIKTLDGYYSNYDLEYKSKWERMIEPTLLVNEGARNYWKTSNGQRAYIYGVSWVFPDYLIDYDNIEVKDMLIDADVLRELNCTYIFSRVKITNADELGLKYIGTWIDDRNFYKISVYDCSEAN